MFKAFLVLVAFVAIGYGARLPRNVEAMFKTKMNEIEECRPLFGDHGSTDIPSCPAEVNTCFSGVHDQARQCMFQEAAHWMKKPGGKECREEHKEKGKAWIRQACVMQTSVRKCMAGDQPGDDDVFEETEGTPSGHMKHFKKPCWKEVKVAMKECHKQAVAGCPDFKKCSGKGPEPDDERLKTWWKVARYNKQLMGQKIKIAKMAFKQCLESKKADAW